MEKELEKMQEQTTELKVETEVKEPERKVSKAWEAAQRLKGTVVINDPTLFWR